MNTIKTKYGKFYIRFAAVKVWNHLDESKSNILVLLFMRFPTGIYVFINLLFIFSLSLFFID